MRLKICTYILVLFSPLLLKSQDEKGRFYAGLLAGINSSQIHGDGFGGFNKFSGAVGGLVQTRLSDKWLAQLEIMYIGKGSFNPPRPKIGYFNFTRISFHYIDVPLIFKLNFKKFYFDFGTSFGTLFSDRYRDANGEILPFFQGGLKKWEWSWLVGIEYDITNRLSLNTRYLTSFLPIAGNRYFDRYWFSFFGGAYNISVLFSLRYTFRPK